MMIKSQNFIQLFIYAFMNILSYRSIDIKCFIFIAVGFVKEISEIENGSFWSITMKFQTECVRSKEFPSGLVQVVAGSPSYC